MQNALLLLGSYLFYAWFSWKFLALIIISSAFSYCCGLSISKAENEKRKSFFLYLAIFQSLGLLLFFKYFNFFITAVADLLATINLNPNIHTLKIILPLGISFYTFRLISYILDVYNEKIDAANDWVAFFNYVAFFPCLLAGPIDRADNFIPQLEKKRQFSYAQTVDGFRQILWGLFKKIVIADSCAPITNQLFDHYQDYPGSSLLIGAFLYIIQIYADFSGYSDMAIGIAKLLGFNIPKNFNYPFFAQNIAEFWKRWHISLTSWMTEYVYTPLSFIFRSSGKKGVMLSIIINFVLVGLWHGSNWTFIIFGLLHGLYFIPLILNGTLTKRNKTTSNLKMWFGIFSTFAIVMLTAVIFRCESISMAFEYYTHMFSKSLISKPLITTGYVVLMITLLYITLMFVTEWFGKNENYGIAGTFIKKSRALRWSFYMFLVISIYYFSFVDKTQLFMYLQF
ncbi:MBOAT family O-acyltransferase [Flavobacterium wongokense]|uniref:MBOAT family O-acyltransferase n=1 Tax=Flavobacterium wongokense TaxID=2910674 RepID=UPI001F25DD92|nr:MBOAT family O-acyltransferase [Flavobacterium sp. WG47]MCF6132540.1 MBOAT family protein [Flavobacterium sp. WG47]